MSDDVKADRSIAIPADGPLPAMLIVSDRALKIEAIENLRKCFHQDYRPGRVLVLEQPHMRFFQLIGGRWVEIGSNDRLDRIEAALERLGARVSSEAPPTEQFPYSIPRIVDTPTIDLYSKDPDFPTTRMGAAESEPPSGYKYGGML